jgi:hypothetical protein
MAVRERKCKVLAHLLGRNGFPEEDELCKNNGRSDSNFSHLVETNTAHS